MHAQSSATLTFAMSSSLPRTLHTSVLWQVSLFLHLPQKAQARIFSHPPDVRCHDVRCLWNLTLLLPRTHPLTFLCMFRNNVLDLTRDNHLFPFALLDLIVLFSSAGPFFCYSELKTPYVAITCRHLSRHPRPPAPSVCLMPSSPTPQGRPLIPFSLLSPLRLTVTCSGAHPDSPSLLAILLLCCSTARCMNASNSPVYYWEN